MVQYKGEKIIYRSLAVVRELIVCLRMSLE